MVPGCILSGGEARRLGGKGKALVKISNHLMIDLVISNVIYELIRISYICSIRLLVFRIGSPITK